MAKTKYKPKYCRQLMQYFLKFIEMRDDPDESDAAERHGMTAITIENGKAKQEIAPSTGYPTLTKFAIKIGVTPRTIRNWRAEFAEFDEMCEFAESILNDVLDERALTGKVDGRVAMKIRELLANAKKEDSGPNGGSKIIFEIKDDREGERLEIKQWDGEVHEDRDY